MFQKAERRKAKLRLALSGPSGSGKTYGALQIAKGLGGKVAVIDTERGSASLYADLLDFDVVELGPPYTPERYSEMVRAAEKAGYDVLVIDSITHEWKGQGGVLEIVDTVARAKFRGNTYAAWNEGNARHSKFIDSILHSSLHVITTMRSKAVYVETESNGKKKMEKQGTAPEQRDGLEYEFTAVLDLTCDGNFANRSKDRTRLFNDPFVITADTGRALLEWLEGGKPAPEQKQVDMHEVEAAFFSATTESDLKQAAAALGVNEGHPQRAAVVAAYRQRLAEIQGAQQAATNGAAQEHAHA
jgi:hypothetical protein